MENPHTYTCASLRARFDGTHYHLTQLGEPLGKGSFVRPAVLVAEVFHDQHRILRTVLALDEEPLLEQSNYPERVEALKTLEMMPQADVQLKIYGIKTPGIGEVLRLLWVEQE